MPERAALPSRTCSSSPHYVTVAARIDFTDGSLFPLVAFFFFAM